ncbi:MAG: hypothetical protein IPM69_14105 [Ignavibacteria bacterium]|nr:hypothetical protein [Ignavibacteria bacterium]
MAISAAELTTMMAVASQVFAIDGSINLNLVHSPLKRQPPFGYTPKGGDIVHHT